MSHFTPYKKPLFATMSACMLALSTLLLSGCDRWEQESFGGSPRGETTSTLPWTTVTSDDRKFEVSMPGKAKRTTTKVDTVFGNIDMHSHFVERNSGRVAYFVNFSDYPYIDDRDGALDGCIEGMVEYVDGTVTNKTNIEMAGHTAREITFEGSSQGQRINMHARVLLVENRLYQLLVVEVPGEVQRSDVDRFFQSFELLPE